MSFRTVSLGLLAAGVVAAIFAYLPAPISRAQFSSSSASSQTALSCCSGTVAPRELDFPYYNLTDGYVSTLYLASDSPKPIDLTVAIRGLAAQMLFLAETIQPEQKLSIDLASAVTKLGGDPTETYAQGSDAPVIAEVTLEFQGRQHKLPQPLTFTPYEAKVLSINQLLLGIGTDPAQAPEGGITILGAGASPALIATGRIVDPATGFSSTIEFLLPEFERASALHAAGLPVGVPSKDSPFAGAGDFTPRVVVRNLLSTPQQVTITVEYPQPPPPTQPSPTTATPSPQTSGTTVEHVIPRPPVPGDKNDHPEWGPGTGGRTGMYTLAPLTVAGYSTEDFSLAAVMSQLPLPLPFCSIRIQYSGAPGSMEAEVSSVEVHSNLVVDARVENEGNGWAGSGANPWHLDSNTESILFLTNESGKPARIGLSVAAGGIHYYLTELKLQPHETRAINLRSLRDAQVADFKKNQIPADATDGVITWVRLDNLPVMGRLMVIRRGQGMASSYDCCICSCPNSFQAVEVPNNGGYGFAFLPGAAENFSATAVYVDCNDSPYYYDVTDVATWMSSSTSIATVETYGDSSPGLMTAVAVGQTTISAFYWDAQYTYDYSSGSCQATQVQENGYCPITVENSGCGDDRDTIISEYYNYPTQWPNPYIPICSDFTNSGHTSDFTFAELNVNQTYNWAILLQGFLNGLQATRNTYGSPMTLNSGYREPAENADVGGAPASQHVFGDAADIASDSTTWKMLAHDANVEGACVEPESESGSAHVHMDWRGTCPSGWTGN